MTLKFFPVRGFRPDTSEINPGGVDSMDGFFPNRSGVEVRGGDEVSRSANIGGEPFGGATLYNVEGDGVVTVATGATIYELSASASAFNVVGSGYAAASAQYPWTFAQYGNISIAASRANQIQAKEWSIGGAYSSIAGAPKAAVVVVALDFVLAFNTDDASSTASASSTGVARGSAPHGWWCSAAGDYTDWTPDIATLSGNGFIYDGAGPIVAAAVWGGDVIVYKNRSMFRGTFVGRSPIWRFTKIADIGCVGPRALVVTEDAHYFWSDDGFYRFRGSYPEPIGQGKCDEFAKNLTFPSARFYTYSFYDRERRVVAFAIPSVFLSVDYNQFLCYSIDQGEWYKMTLDSDANNVRQAFEGEVPTGFFAGKYCVIEMYNQGSGNFYPRFMQEFPNGVKVSLTTSRIGQRGIVSNFKRIRPEFKDYLGVGATPDPQATVVRSRVSRNEGITTDTQTEVVTTATEDGFFSMNTEAEAAYVTIEWPSSTGAAATRLFSIDGFNIEAMPSQRRAK